MEDILMVVGISLLIFVLCMIVPFGMALCLTVPTAHGFNEHYGTEYSVLYFMFNEETLRDYHGRSVIIKE